MYQLMQKSGYDNINKKKIERDIYSAIGYKSKNLC